ncbi:hypothetical protein EXIGLDRAFT_784305 [Exidia glandulosa HHB12029]|uniref:F-box domain-containing protein n=1 Tax=Exidia glandulosa HHB12029 TaxID=1314781 RepID=A0A166MJA8_EXIGL|nr:hypothetical protein EXIGLDRAFT_784305 [Exidia glandulosa HHB12029]
MSLYQTDWSKRPLVEEALPRVHILEIWLESIYRLQLEKVLSNPAPLLRVFHLNVRLFNTILPRDVIPAFSRAEEVLWVHTKWTMQAEFHCYLFDFFPKVRKLRLNGGGMEFRNAPLPVTVIERFKQLELLELQFIGEYIPGFFRHLPMHSLPQLLISDAEEDGVYAAQDPLRSPFHLSIYATSGAEFVITVEGQKPKLVRHLLEAHKYYKPGSQLTNALLDNEEFAAQLATLEIHTSLWSMLHPWLPSFVSLPKLIVEIDEYTSKSVTLQLEALPCPALQALVLQAKHDFVYIAAEEVLAFVDRITLQAVRLELCRVFVDGSLDLLAGRFSPVVRTQDRIGPSKHPTC